MNRWVQLLSGAHIAFDGVDGCGKTTMTRKLFEIFEREKMMVKLVREPGGTEYGEMIREVLLHKQAKQPLCMEAEMLLFAAARAQLAQEVLLPYRCVPMTILSDRSISSTLAYQGSRAGGLKLDMIWNLYLETVPESCQPDCTVILDLPPAVARTRVPLADKQPDRIEARDAEYHRKVREGFLRLPVVLPKRFLLVDASGTPEEVEDQVFQRLTDFLEQRAVAGPESASA